MPAAPGPRVQVYIPVYNDIRFLPTAIGSVLGQTGVDVEVIVSDNASTDGTYEYALALAEKEPRLRVVRNPQNLGYMANINKVAGLATATYYMVLCSDDMLLDEGALRKAMRVMEGAADVVSVYCDMDYIDAKGRRVMTRRFRRSGPFDSEAALRRSIIASRNLFGIPLLHRTAVAARFRYRESLTYTLDVVHSAETARQGKVYHLPEALIGNRFTGHNATWGLFSKSRGQFEEVAKIFGLKLTLFERLAQEINRAVVTVSKTAFLLWMRLRK